MVRFLIWHQLKRCRTRRSWKWWPHRFPDRLGGDGLHGRLLLQPPRHRQAQGRVRGGFDERDWSPGCNSIRCCTTCLPANCCRGRSICRAAGSGAFHRLGDHCVGQRGGGAVLAAVTCLTRPGQANCSPDSTRRWHVRGQDTVRRCIRCVGTRTPVLFQQEPEHGRRLAETS